MIGTNRSPILAWPGWRHLCFSWWLTVLVTAWFALVFAGANSFTASHPTRVRVHLDAELQIPLVPGFIIFYLSIYLLFAAIPFVLRTRREVTSLALAQCLAIGLAGICFLLIPAQLAYAPPTGLGVWQGTFRFADAMNLDYNLVPSLHVALSFICIECFAAHRELVGKALLRNWGMLIAASTVLTHQHHLLDVLSGGLLAAGSLWLGRRIEKLWAPSEISTPPASYSA